MAVYRFRVSFEEHEDIWREIEIKSDQTFKDLHNGIQEAIGFDASQPASFYMSNDHWVKGQEISLKKRPPRNNEENILMKNAVLSDWIVDPHQKIYYEFDYSSQWTFFVELVRIIPVTENRKKYPACVKVNGEALKQHAVIYPVKEDETEADVSVVEIANEIDEDEEREDGVEEVIDENEADEITDEEVKEEKGSDDAAF